MLHIDLSNTFGIIYCSESVKPTSFALPAQVYRSCCRNNVRYICLRSYGLLKLTPNILLLLVCSVFLLYRVTYTSSAAQVEIGGS